MLKRLSVTGSIDLPPCAPWEAVHNPLHREPAAKENANPNSVVALVRRAEQTLKDLNLTERTYSNYRYDGFDWILRRHFELGLTDYSSEVAADVAENARTAYETGPRPAGVRKMGTNCKKSTMVPIVGIY